MNKIKTRFSIIFLIFTGINVISCSGDNNPTTPDPVESSYTYQVPVEDSDGWNTSSLSDEGMRVEPIINMMNYLSEKSQHYFNSILIVRNGNLVFEEYFTGRDAELRDYTVEFIGPIEFNKNITQCMASATKSVNSILFGIAVDKGYIQSLDQKMIEFFPEYEHLSSVNKNSITLQHMLTMTAGMHISEEHSFTDPRNELIQFWKSADPIQFIFEKPELSAPGDNFEYDSGTSCLLGEIVRRSTGVSLMDFGNEYLFTPLGITTAEWVGFESDPDMAFASSGLYLRPRDMTKIGQLYLQDGIWNDQQIVSSAWIQESTSEFITFEEDYLSSGGYGYQWWMESYSNGTINGFSARGHGLQFIVVLPDVNMVIVLTGGFWEESPFYAPVHYYNLIENYILQAIQ
ncbi:serine hydrolase domain-containing protein [candidate division KSB1 bacterium]